MKGLKFQYRILPVLMTTCLFNLSHCARHYQPENNGFFDKINTIFEKGGSAAVKLFIDRELNDWKSVNINIGVTGPSGSGKSSFINTILGLTADDEGSAEVGVIETTKTIKSYPHPANQRLVFWDLPGVGTPNFPRDEYFNKVNFDRFDYFILITSDRFREDDLWLATELRDKRKLYYFLRNKVGQDILNDQKMHPKSHNEAKLLDQMRTNCVENLQKSNLTTGVYLIDTFFTSKYDFDTFTVKLLNDAPDMKKDAMILSMTVMTEGIINAKKEAIAERIHKVSILSGIVGAVPVPLLDAGVDMAILLEEAIFYRNQFGLSEEMLQEYATYVNIPIDELKRLLGLKSTLIKLTSQELLKYFTKKGTKAALTYTTSKYVKYILPVFGNAISGAASYTLTSWCLHDLLDLMAEDALKIYHHLKTV